MQPSFAVERRKGYRPQKWCHGDRSQRTQQRLFCQKQVLQEEFGTKGGMALESGGAG